MGGKMAVVLNILTLVISFLVTLSFTYPHDHTFPGLGSQQPDTDLNDFQIIKHWIDNERLLEQQQEEQQEQQRQEERQHQQVPLDEREDDISDGVFRPEDLEPRTSDPDSSEQLLLNSLLESLKCKHFPFMSHVT